MNNYLLQILKETKTIIIPGLGALTVTNEATGEIMFMSFLKHDDGNLAKYISEKEGMDLNDAKNLIAKYVREIQAEIDKGDKYSMYQFGSFYKLDGEVAFEQWFTGSPELTSTDGGSTPEEKPEVVKENVVEPIIDTPAPIVEEPAKPVVEETPIIEEEKIEPIIELEKPVAIEEIKPVEKTPIAEEAEEIIVPPIIEKPIEVEAVKEETVVPPIEKTEPIVTKVDTPTSASSVASAQPVVTKKVEPVKTKSPKEQLKAADKQVKPAKKKTGVFAYILWGFVVLILGAGTYVAVQFDTLKKDFPILAELTGEEVPKEKDTTLLSLGEKDPVANPDSMPEVETVPGDEVIESEPTVETPIEEPKPEPVKKPASTKKPEVTPKPVAAKPTPKPVVVKPTPKPVVTSTYTPSKPAVKAANFPAPNLSMPYHVIVGSFSSKMNARNFATKLKGMGMSNLTIGEKDGLFKVSVNGYATEDEAKAALPSLKNISPTAWVFNWK